MSAKGYHYLLLQGHLRLVVEDGVVQWRFAEETKPGDEPVVHPINPGDMLRILDREETLVWSGVIAYNFTMCSEPVDEDNPEVLVQKIGGKVVNGIQGTARPKEWLKWFERGYEARLEIRINEQNSPRDPDAGKPASDEPEDPVAMRERLIKGVLHAHDSSSAAKPAPAHQGDKPKNWWED